MIVDTTIDLKIYKQQKLNKHILFASEYVNLFYFFTDNISRVGVLLCYVTEPLENQQNGLLREWEAC
jgi:hypothetical protein